MAAADPRSPEERRAALRMGMTLGERWTLERVLGVGGMAAVYAVRGPDGSAAALELLHPEHAIRKEIRDRFLREGLAANSVGHPGAVRILDSAVLQASGVRAPSSRPTSCSTFSTRRSTC